MPGELRRWKPEEKSPLPPPPMAFYELEAAKQFGYKVSDWFLESDRNRAMAMAHLMHSNLREAYQMEKVSSKAKSKKDDKTGPDASYSALLKSMGLG